jgi:copper(I)-binding protein
MNSRLHYSTVATLSGLILAGLAMLLGGCAPSAIEPLQIEAARVRLPLPGTDKTVGYFEVTNNTTVPVVLIGARCEQARAVEFHTMVRDGDMLRMRRLLEVPIAAGESVSFAPGGNHLMIFGVEALADNVEIVFTATDGAEYRHTFRTFALDEQ